jgi:hypothetical protein
MITVASASTNRSCPQRRHCRSEERPVQVDSEEFDMASTFKA